MVMSVRYRTDMAERNGGGSRLSRERWCLAALEQIAAGGTRSVSVEGLARDLGATKGSFYWHFDDRSELVTASLTYWADMATHRLISELGEIVDPRERISTLVHLVFTDELSLLDVALATAVDDPAVTPVVDRVTTARIEFLTAAFREMGVAPAAARRRGHAAYAAYLGTLHLARSLGTSRARRRLGPAYLDDLIALLLP